MNLTGDLNWYDLYRWNYPSAVVTADERFAEVVVDGITKTYKRGYTQKEYTPWIKHLPLNDEVIYGDYVTWYVNQPEVRAALNIPSYV